MQEKKFKMFLTTSPMQFLDQKNKKAKYEE